VGCSHVKNNKKGVGKAGPDSKPVPRSYLSAETMGKQEAQKGTSSKNIYGSLPQ
jgi:hypothetical protein